MKLRSFRFAFIAALILTAALPLSAAKRRSVVSATPGAEGTFSGIVVDAETGAPVVLATVDANGARVSTDNAGKFTIKGSFPASMSVEVRRTGYETLRQTVTTAGGSANVTFRLRSGPTVQLTTTSGTKYVLDYETAQFAYAVPFSGYVRNDVANFCRSDNGQAYTPNKSELRRVIGPGRLLRVASCCPNMDVVVTDVETKAGERFQVVYNESCTGTEVDFLGRDHATAQFVYLKIQDVAEIIFP